VIDVIEWTQDVSLDRPVLVVALSGWVDAGSAGAMAAAHVEEALEDPVTFARVDLSEIVDLQATRPTVELVDGVTRSIAWPEITFTAGHAGRDVVVVQGPEPSVRWKSFAAEVVQLATDVGAELAVTLGGMPAPASHRRPVRVLTTATTRALAQESAPVRGDYEGPTGAQTVVQIAMGDAGLGGLGLWAQVPHYLAGTISPAAERALLSRLMELTGIDLDLSDLDARAAEYTRQVEQTISTRDDLAELVDRLEGALDELPTGDELVSEIEEFLRREG